MQNRSFFLGNQICKLLIILVMVSGAFVVQARQGSDPDTSLSEELNADAKPNLADESAAQIGAQIPDAFDPASEEIEIGSNIESAEDLASFAKIDAEFEAAEMQEITLELSESFDLLHKGDRPGQAEKDLTSKLNMCAATKFIERKSLLSHLKLGGKKSRSKMAKKNALKSFLADITLLRNQIRNESFRRSEIRGPAVQTTVSNFQKSCQLPFREFLPEIKLQAKKRQIPVETLLSMMSIESRGDCFASVEEGGKDPTTGQPLYSRGLFQVHAKFTKLSGCSENQKEEIRNAKSVTKLKLGPSCIENPILNLRAAAKVLADKAKALVKKSKPYEIYYLDEKNSRNGQHCWQKKWITVAGFEKSKLVDKKGNWNPNLWRMAISAYNGGERWVFRAKRNIEAFNSLHGTQVDAYNWDSLKDYYFRRTLNRKQQLRYFGGQERDRDLDYAILNVIYAESMVPSLKVKKTSNKDRNLADLWQSELHKKHSSQERVPTSK